MKKLIVITGTILMLCLFTGSFFAPAATAEANTAEQTERVNVYSDIYVLKSENNRLVVYKKGDKTPFMTTDTPVNNLPKGDIMLLERGIEIKGKENLNKSLEDYCS